MSTKIKRLSTRSYEVAFAIKDKEDFDTHGALSGRNVASLGSWDSGQLAGADLDAFRTDASAIRYVVWSYSTPIAWCTLSGRWHKVAQRFSRTTSAHQGKLYMVKDENGH